jgi:hypothetical protein
VRAGAAHPRSRSDDALTGSQTGPPNGHPSNASSSILRQDPTAAAESTGTTNCVVRSWAVATEDLATHRYAGRARDFDKDLRAITSQGLAQIREVWTSPRRPALRLLVLTKRGRQALESIRSGGVGQAQAFYSGLVKGREARHDAAVYRMFHAEEARIQREGGRVRRVVLDFELKRLVYRPLAKARGLSPKEFAALQTQVARANGLVVVHGKIPLPDLRIEFDTRSGEQSRVDLELATEHYHGRALAEKAQAGFTFYAADGSAAKLSQALEERDITVAILSL